VLSGANYRKPTGVFVHGFLTVDGKKMSKSRGTFITAQTFAKHLDPDFLRYYYAGKLGPSADDIDLNLEDFLARVNSDLVGKLVNIASRCAGFIHRLNNGKMAADLVDEKLFSEFLEAGNEISINYEKRNYAQNIRAIMALADRANQYIDEQKPWIKAKQPDEYEEVIGICSLGLNFFRLLVIYLKPVLPLLAEKVEAFLNIKPLIWEDTKSPLLDHTIEPFKSLMQRIESDQIEAIVTESLSQSPTDQ